MTLISELKEQCGATPKASELSPAWASLERRTWTIPGSKASVTVPLTDAAIDVLRGRAEAQRWVLFP
ncbi:MAG: hypothetical protein ACYCQM_04275 [Acidithiobacillus sp.]